MLGRRHEPRPRPQHRLLPRPLRLDRRPGVRARGGRLHDVQPEREERRRREPAAAGQEGVPPHWTTYIASDDADATAEKIRGAGGTVFAEPFDVFDSGRMTIAQDPTGAVFGVWQAREHIGAELANEPGTLNWNECQTDDPAKAAAFYKDVFGYEVDEAPMGDADVTASSRSTGGASPGSCRSRRR